MTIITITTNDDNDYDDQRVAQVADEDYDDNNENQCVITTIAIMMTKGDMLSFRWDGTSFWKNLYDDDFDHNDDTENFDNSKLADMLSFRWDGTSLRKNEEFNLREDLAWSFFHTVKVVHI